MWTSTTVNVVVLFFDRFYGVKWLYSNSSINIRKTVGYRDANYVRVVCIDCSGGGINQYMKWLQLDKDEETYDKPVLQKPNNTC